MRVVHPGGADEEYDWYKSGRLATHTNERGLVSTWAYDDLGRTISEDLPGALARTWSYTNGVSTGSGMYGTEVLRTEPDGGDFTTQMDFAGRAVLSENPYGETTSWAYEGSQLKTVAYGFGGTDLAMEKYGYDSAGRMEWRWGPEAAATMSSSSPAAGNYAYWYAYSDAGRLLSREGPNDLTEWEWTDGVKTAEVVSGVSTTTYTYASDAPRVLEKLVGDSSQLRATSYSYDNLGRLEEAFTDDGAETVLQTWYDRDIYDQPRSQSREVSGVVESTLTRTTNARGWTLTQSMETPSRSVEAEYEREVDGALKEQWVQWGGGALRGVEFVRGGAEGQLMQLRDPSGTTPFASSFVRDDAGRITSVTANGGATTSTDYDLLGRISNRTVTQGSDYRSIEYVYDHRGRVEEVTRTSATATKTSSFIYDEPGWLSLETHVDAAGTRSIAYTYDDAGNRTSRAETTSAGTTTRTFTYDYGNVLASVNGAAPVWNAFGETEEDHRGAGIVRAADGAEIGLVGPPSGGGAGTALYAFTRGAGGEATEVEDLVAGGLRSFLWGAGEADFPVSTLDEGGIEQMYVAAEGMVLGRLDGGTFVPMAQDGQGSMLLDGADFLDVGAAFGEDATPVSGSPERRVYALLEDLPGTPYKLPRRRLYDEETGRFASQDPIGLMGGDHRFAYVGGDPMGAVDPSGLAWGPSPGADQGSGLFGTRLLTPHKGSGSTAAQGGSSAAANSANAASDQSKNGANTRTTEAASETDAGAGGTATDGGVPADQTTGVDAAGAPLDGSGVDDAGEGGATDSDEKDNQNKTSGAENEKNKALADDRNEGFNRTPTTVDTRGQGQAAPTVGGAPDPTLRRPGLGHTPGGKSGPSGLGLVDLDLPVAPHAGANEAALPLIVLTPEAIALGTAAVAVGHRVVSDPYFVDDAGDAAEAVLDCAQSQSVGTCVVAAVQVATAAIPGNTAQPRDVRKGMAGAVQKGFDEAVEVLDELAEVAKSGDKVGALPKPPRGAGSVPLEDRDSQRLFTPDQRAEKLVEQGGKCATGCGTTLDQDNSRGHHIVRHADGGRTTSENHAEVCKDCHKKLHSP